MRTALSPIFLAVTLSLGVVSAHAGDLNKVNGSVRVEKGQSVDSASTVNGSVTVEDDAKIGKASTVNGSITLGNKVTVNAVKAVNGAIKGGQGVQIEDSITAVNGGVHLGESSTVKNITNVNGKIDLTGVQVREDIETVNGSIELSGATKVTGRILYREPKGQQYGNQKLPTLLITAGVEVGSIILEREVDLQIDKNAKVGKIEKRYENK